jgi:hypothetical protein
MLWALALALTAVPSLAADYLAPTEGSWVVRDFRFHTGETLPINSADDERNPPELGLLDREIKRVKNGRVFLIPASDQTAGHGTTGQARFWKQQLAELLQSAPRKGK